MFLKYLHIKNFKCFTEITFDSIGKLAVFIGENDSGKTSILDAIEILVTNKSCKATEFRRLSRHERENEVLLHGVFQLEDHDNIPTTYTSGAVNDQFEICKKFSLCNTDSVIVEYTIKGQGYSDPGFDNFVGAEHQKNLLTKYGVSPASNEEGRKRQIESLIAQEKLSVEEKDLVLSGTVFNTNILPHLPNVERVSSAHYRMPNTMIQQTLQKAIAGVLNLLTRQPEEMKSCLSLNRYAQRFKSSLIPKFLK